MADFDNDHLQEIFSSFGEISVRKMFGGKGIYHKGLIFAIIFEDGLRLRGDALIAPKWNAQGSFIAKYTQKNTGKTVDFPYYNVPDSCLEDSEEMRKWAKEAYEAALRADAKKK